MGPRRANNLTCKDILTQFLLEEVQTIRRQSEKSNLGFGMRKILILTLTYNSEYEKIFDTDFDRQL